MEDNTTHIMEPFDWNNLDTTTVYAEIDEDNDGIIDSTTSFKSQTNVLKIENNSLVDEFQLFQNYPNPFNLTTTIKYQIAKPCKVRITIYNNKGQVIKTLIDKNMSPGIYKIAWNGKDDNGLKVTSGIYFYIVSTSNIFEPIYYNAKKLIFLK